MNSSKSSNPGYQQGSELRYQAHELSAISFQPSESNTLYLSIVVPIYNEEESVEKLVSRIVEIGNQFDFAYEIILVDDGSADKTWQVIERLKKSTPVPQWI